ncbi:hypothetical protein KC331_g14128 [Hortaea werneckii]|nr:hypothetical protein KC331_g14128 [Hortaea werneckii]KAI7704209.1 hypothetical protein KC353_g13602 [Hortaea werneckii]
MTRIVIVGAGIAGLTLYLFLHDLGLTANNETVVVEAKTASSVAASTKQPPSADSETCTPSRDVGASIGLASNGMRVLAHLDGRLVEEIRRTGHGVEQWRLSTARGWTLARMKTTGGVHVMIGREDFWRCLRRRVPESVIRSGKVMNVVFDGRSNKVLLDNGASIEAELVVGGDGVWSVVRRAIFDAEGHAGEYQFSPKYEGLIGVGGFLSADMMVDVPDGEMNVVFGRNGFFGYGYTRSCSTDVAKHGDKAVWWSTYSLRSLPEEWQDIDREDVRQSLRSRHSAWRNKVIQGIIETVQIDGIWPTFTTPVLPTWERQGCVLIGDAAHALQPSSGQGANQALEDAEMLALLLAHHLGKDQFNGHRNACKRYSELRIPRLAKIHKQSQKMARMKEDMGFFMELLMYAWIWLINKLSLNSEYMAEIQNYDARVEVDAAVRG